MPWSRHAAEVTDVCSRSHPHSGHLSECVRAYFRESFASLTGPDQNAQMYGSLFSWSLGCIVFPLCLGAFQIGIFKPLSLTTSHILSPALGLCSVATSGVAASLTVLMSYSSYQKASGNYGEVDIRFSDVLFYGIGTAAVFKLLRGKYSSVLPSTILRPGAFATDGIPATKNYASSGKKARLAALGSRHGCHTCGKRWTAKSFIADHQPPLSLPKRSDVIHSLRKFFFPHRPDYKFYPQCPSCSSVQCNYLSAMSAQRNTSIGPRKIVRVDYNHIITHATSLRLYHLYTPVPLIMAGVYHFCGG